MAGLRFDVVPYLSIAGNIPDKHESVWYFFVLVTDPDGTPHPGLVQGSFTIRVAGMGSWGPYDQTTMAAFLDSNANVPFSGFFESSVTPGIYVFKVAESQLSFKTPYVLSISASPSDQRGAVDEGRALVSYRPPDWEPLNGPVM